MTGLYMKGRRRPASGIRRVLRRAGGCYGSVRFSAGTDGASSGRVRGCTRSGLLLCCALVLRGMLVQLLRSLPDEAGPEGFGLEDCLRVLVGKARELFPEDLPGGAGAPLAV